MTRRRVCQGGLAVWLTAQLGCGRDRAIVTADKPTLLQEAHVRMVELAGLAAHRADEAKVRRLARLLRADHEHWSARIERFARKGGYALLSPPEDAGQQELQQWRLEERQRELLAAHGADFDNRFVKTMLEGHHEILSELHAIDRFPDERGELEQLLLDGRRIERQHLDVAVAVFADMGIAQRK